MTLKRTLLYLTIAALVSLQSGQISSVAQADQVILDDLIVDGSLCVGFDCVNGESFGFDTIRLKENNLRIKFQDTSSTASFPSNDWQITINDSSNGGLNKFSIDDIDGGRTPFTIEAGAPSHSLYVDDGGRLGLGTSTPVVDLHVKSGNTPTHRLEQDGSSGFTPQTWDVAGNEANFFIRDATNGSTLPFRIFPGAPSNAITIEATTGDVGLGTTSPGAALHVRRADGTAKILVEEASGTTAKRDMLELENNGLVRMVFRDSNTGEQWKVGLDLIEGANDVFAINRKGTGGVELVIFKGGRVKIGPGASFVFNLSPTGNLTINGALTQLSSRKAKENLTTVDGPDVLARLEALPISTWSYKTDAPDKRHMGPVAEDFHAAFGLGADDKHIAPMDAAAVALAAIKAQQAKITALAEQVSALEDLVSRLLEDRG